MGSARHLAFRLAFEALALSHVSGLVRKLSSCRGVIFTLHRVLPEPPADFSPNAILQVTPDFLRTAIRQTRAAGFDIVHLDEAIRRIESRQTPPPFAVFTFDDAYRDNLVHALPILREEQCPFTLFVPTAFVDGVGEVWWQALEDMIATRDAMAIRYGDVTDYLEIRTLGQKHAAYDQIYCRMREMPELDRIALLREMAWGCGMDLERHCRDLVMDWPELQVFADEPLCTLGAHTVNHYELSKLPEDEARAEIGESLRVLEAQFGRRPRHFSYPIGSRVAAGPREYALAAELGLRSAVTTIPGGLYARHAHKLMALPRISLNGLYQERRFLDVFLTGAYFTRIGRS